MPKKKNPRRLPKTGAYTSAPSTPKRKSSKPPPPDDFSHATAITTAPFELREDGTVAADASAESRVPELILSEPSFGVRLYRGNCLELLDAVAARHPDGYFDMIFADPPYFLSNGGITCHAGKMVKVDKGDWDKSRGPVLNHEFNTEWLRRCQRVLKPNGTIWVTGTSHVIFSIGYAMQQLGYKILNDIAWEKPNPPPNLSCRYFTHSTETIIWAAKNEKSKHVFNYQAMRAVTGKQMKTVWRGVAADGHELRAGELRVESHDAPPSTNDQKPSTPSDERRLVPPEFPPQIDADERRLDPQEFQPLMHTDEHGLNHPDSSEKEICVNPAPSAGKNSGSSHSQSEKEIRVNPCSSYIK